MHQSILQQHCIGSHRLVTILLKMMMNAITVKVNEKKGILTNERVLMNQKKKTSNKY